MPMIDVTAKAGTFRDKPALTKALTAALMKWEQVPLIPWFTDNTAAFIRELPADALSNANGDTNYVRIDILTPTGVLTREKKLGVTKELTEIVAAAAGDPSVTQRTWVLISETPDGGWGIDGHAYLNNEIADEARRQLGKK
ncbi:MAG TPA: tautomerase family protein [Magnetospirillaceae bacterium]|jgi:phenylpyruvate tautomerase PptA (4-oxalocrotonate tautomerase family)